MALEAVLSSRFSSSGKGQRGWERSEHLGEVTARREEEEEGQQKAQGSAQV